MERNIHQIWFDWGRPNPPKNQQVYIDNWVKMHPTWQHRLWAKEEAREFVKVHMPEILDVYDNLRYNIQRCDLFRLIAVYVLGGAYVDADIVPLRNIDDLAPYDLVLAARPLQGTTNYFFAARSGNKFVKRLIDRIVREHPKKRKGLSALSLSYYILESTGPKLFEKELADGGVGEGKTISLHPAMTSDRDVLGTLLKPPKGSGGAYMHHRSEWGWFDSNPNEEPWMYLASVLMILFLSLVVFMCVAMTYGLRERANFEAVPLKKQMAYSYAAISVLILFAIPAVTMLVFGLVQGIPMYFLVATILGSVAVFVPVVLLLIAWAVFPMSKKPAAAVSVR